MGFPKQEYWSRLPFPPPRNHPDPEIEPRSPALWADSLLPEPAGKLDYQTNVIEKVDMYDSLFLKMCYCSGNFPLKS